MTWFHFVLFALAVQSPNLFFHVILGSGSYPYMLQVQGNVPDKRLDESLLQPELLLGLVKRFIFNLVKRQVNEERSEKKTQFYSQDSAVLAVIYLG